MYASIRYKHSFGSILEQSVNDTSTRFARFCGDPVCPNASEAGYSQWIGRPRTDLVHRGVVGLNTVV